MRKVSFFDTLRTHKHPRQTKLLARKRPKAKLILPSCAQPRLHTPAGKIKTPPQLRRRRRRSVSSAYGHKRSYGFSLSCALVIERALGFTDEIELLLSFRDDRPARILPIGVSTRSRFAIGRMMHSAVEKMLRSGPNRAAEQGDELALVHSITSSASASKVGGRSNPSAFEALRLITSSNLLAWITGRSPGFSPLRIRPA